MRRSKGTEIESCYLLPLGKTSWPSKVDITKEDKATTMDIEMQSKPQIPKMSPKDATSSHPDFIQRYRLVMSLGLWSFQLNLVCSIFIFELE